MRVRDATKSRAIPAFKKNSALPIKATRTFVTKVDDQRSIVIRVLEGESRDPSECSLIGHAIIRDLVALSTMSAINSSWQSSLDLL